MMNSSYFNPIKDKQPQPVSHVVMLTLCTLFAILYGIWLLPHPVFIDYLAKKGFLISAKCHPHLADIAIAFMDYCAPIFYWYGLSESAIGIYKSMEKDRY